MVVFVIAEWQTPV